MISKFYGIEIVVLVRLFDHYLSDDFQYPNQDSKVFWQEQMSKTFSYRENGQRIEVSWKEFSEIAWRIVQLPTSEALCERIFSHLALLFPVNRLRSREDLIRAQTIVRMHYMLNKD